MNRAQRRYGKISRKFDGEGVTRRKKKKDAVEVEEVFPPRSRRGGRERVMQSRCCYISPEQRSIGNLTDGGGSNSPSQHHNSIASPFRAISNLTAETLNRRQYQNGTTETYQPAVHLNSVGQQSQSMDHYPTPPHQIMIAQLEEIHRAMCQRGRPTVENSSQYVTPEGYDGLLHWQNEDSAEFEVFKGKEQATLTKYHSVPKNLRFSEVPRIKLMAVKFTKYKKDNIELRRIDEKVVCVEYDVFDTETDETTPVQKMRAFFSIKPRAGETGANGLTELPQPLKSKFKISDEDLRKLSQKEIEIIDGKIVENQPYLEDLQKILRRRENSTKTIKTTFNLQALYEIGKRDLLDSENNFENNGLSKDDLAEMQSLILKNSKASLHGIRRTTVKDSSRIINQDITNAISRSLLTELLKDTK